MESATKSARVAADANNRKTLPRRPNGYILSYGVSYKPARNEGKDWAELPACPPSASNTHAAFVSQCGFSPTFEPILDEHATKGRILADVRRAAATVVSHDVVVFFFSGHGQRMDDTACVIDGARCVVSVRKLQAVFAEVVVDRELRDVSFVAILDCCQTLSCGKLSPLRWWAHAHCCGNMECVCNLCACAVQGRLIQVMIGMNSIDT